MSSNIKRSAFPSVPIQDVARKVPGAIKIGPFGSQLKKEDLSESGYKVYGQENIIAGDFSLGTRRINSSKFFALKSCQLFPGDVVVTMMGTVGRCEIFPADAEVGIMDSHLLRIQVDPDIADAEFVAAMISAKEIVGRQVARFSHGTIMSGLSSAIVRHLLIPLPQPKVQRRIAEILDTVDAAIRQTDALVAKLKRMKAGLMHDLLTRGLDLQGNLRDPAVHPEQFKDSELGRIPKAWEVTTLGSTLSVLYRYPTYYNIQYIEKGVPEVRGELILDDGTLEVRPEQYRYISEATARAFSKVRLETDDFVMSVRGTMGKIAIVPQQLAGAVITANLIRMQFNQELVRSEWARHFLHSVYFQDKLDLATSATTIKTIQAPALAAIKFSKPKEDEQLHIGAILDAHDARIRAEEDNRDKLKAVKQGLMQDLLTGRVRVNSHNQTQP